MEQNIPQPESVKTSFWDFGSIKVYTLRREKVLDFLVGFFSPIIFVTATTFTFSYLWENYSYIGNIWILPVIIFIALILGIFYFWKRRRFLALGLLLSDMVLLFTLSGFFLLLAIIGIGVGY